MIDENRLIKQLKESNYHHASNSREEVLLDRVIRIVQEQPKVNELIPVTERLPKELEPVLVAYRGYYDKKIYCDNVAYIRAGDWVWNCDEGEVVVEIVAWQPLPKPINITEL